MTTENISSDQSGLDQQLLSMLCCPENKQAVSLIDQEKLQILNEKIAMGKLQNKSGKLVKEKLEGALLRADQAVAYPIRDGIPIMLIDEGLVVTEIL